MQSKFFSDAPYWFYSYFVSVLIPLSKTCATRVRVVQIGLSNRKGTDNKVWIESTWYIQEKFRLQKVGSFFGLWIWNYHRWRQGRMCYDKNIYLGIISLDQSLNHSRSPRGIKLTDFFFQIKSECYKSTKFWFSFLKTFWFWYTKGSNFRE